MMVGGTNTNLVKTLKQRFTSNGRIQHQGNIRYNWSFSLSQLIYLLFLTVLTRLLVPFLQL